MLGDICISATSRNGTRLNLIFFFFFFFRVNVEIFLLFPRFSFLFNAREMNAR